MKCWVIKVLKLLLCLLIVLCSTLVGFSYSSKLYNRKKILESFELEFKNIKTVIRYSSKELYKIFENSFIDYQFNDEEPFSVQWEEMLESYSKTLTYSDIEILSNFGRTLGTSDLAGELNNIDMYLALLYSQISQAKQNIDTKSSVYKTLGLTLGLAVAIILI